eukprot:gene32829-42504_t
MSYGLIYPDSAACAALQTIFVVTGMVSAIAMSVFWFYSLLRHYQTVHYLTFDEKKEMLYLVGCTAFLVGFGVVSAKSSSEWYTIDEKSLLTFCILFTFAMLFLTVVPNRLLKTINEIKDSTLRLKRAFVRYISHEIRSPLSVATAGLELLRRELLDLVVIPLVSLFAGRLEAFRFMASKKSISLEIDDHAQVCDYFTAEEDNVESNVSASLQQGTTAPEPVIRENGSLSTPVLYIDKFRVEQILRNLMSNAIKFTPEGGKIVMRFLRIADVATANGTTTTAAYFHPVGQHSREQAQPVLQLTDTSVAKKADSYLRIEVTDSGAGASFSPSIYMNFHSDGVGHGSTFCVELPIYSRKRDASSVMEAYQQSSNTLLDPNWLLASIDDGGGKIAADARIFPLIEDSVGDRDVEAAVLQPRILIVDDSSPNRHYIVKIY